MNDEAYDARLLYDALRAALQPQTDKPENGSTTRERNP
jgi:hypothetical protein